MRNIKVNSEQEVADKLKPRAYQCEIVEKCRDQNSIVCLGTGSYISKNCIIVGSPAGQWVLKYMHKTKSIHMLNPFFIQKLKTIYVVLYSSYMISIKRGLLASHVDPNVINFDLNRYEGLPTGSIIR